MTGRNFFFNFFFLIQGRDLRAVPGVPAGAGAREPAPGNDANRPRRTPNRAVATTALGHRPSTRSASAQGGARRCGRFVGVFFFVYRHFNSPIELVPIYFLLIFYFYFLIVFTLQL